MERTVSLSIAALLIGTLVPAQQTSAGEDWNAALAEHLLNRAGFGARPAEIQAAVEMGREAFIDHLLKGGAAREPYFAENIVARMASGDQMMDGAGVELDDKARAELRQRTRRQDEEQAADFCAWWVEGMLSGEDPLRERMTLFWHGHFATSQAVVKHSYAMIRQNELFRAHALGRFGDLLRGVVRDAALLKYLDNDENRENSPNENFARELMELFTLGEGRYTEADVKEAARALTGWSSRDGRFHVAKRQHDGGVKTVLGTSGRLDGDDLVDVLLAEPSCGPFLARKLITWFEGVEPEPYRADFYGDFLAANDYDVALFLRRLFNDPQFYRAEVLGTRIASPIDLLVGVSRRLDVQPRPQLLVAASAILGQHLFEPPSVKGWDEGEAWITTSTLMQRGNLAGVLLGVVEIDDVLRSNEPVMEAPPTMEPAGDAEATPADEPPSPPPPASSDGDGERMDEAPAPGADRPEPPKRKLGDYQALKGAAKGNWRPRIFLGARLAAAGAARDGEIVRLLGDELLAIPLSDEAAVFLAGVLAERRGAAGIEEGELLNDLETAEPILRNVAHVLLSLPEAQLH